MFWLKCNPSHLFAFLAVLLLPGVASAQLGGGGAIAVPVAPTVQFGDNTSGNYQAYWTSGTFPVTISITLPPGPPPLLPITVQWVAADGSAKSPTDYSVADANGVTQSGTAIFPPGTTTQTLWVTIYPNGNTAQKAFTITLSNPQGATLGSPKVATITIDLPPPPPTVQFSSAKYWVKEVAGQSTTVKTITVTLSGPSATPVTVNYATSDGTGHHGAHQPNDYAKANGTLTFTPMPADPTNPAITTQTFNVTINNNGKPGPNRWLNSTLSSPSSNSTAGTPMAAVLTIVDDNPPPVLTVTAASNPICAGGMQTAVHQTALTVSITEGGSPRVGVPITLSASAGSLSATSGTSDANGNFTAVLTSGKCASSPSTPFNITVTAVAHGKLTATTQVTVNPPAISLTAKHNTVWTGGEDKLTASLTFGGTPVGGHSLAWSVAAIWDYAGNQVYSGTGTPPGGYGHIEPGASTTSSSANDGTAGTGTAMWEAGHIEGEVKVQVLNMSVRLVADGVNLAAHVTLQEKKPHIKFMVKDKWERLDANTGKFLVGEEILFGVEDIAGAAWEWKAEGFVFKSYTKKEGSDEMRPKGKYELLTANEMKVPRVYMSWYSTAKEKKDEAKPPAMAKMKVTCTVTVGKKAVPVEGEIEIYRPSATLVPKFGKMEFVGEPEKKDGVEVQVEHRLRLTLDAKEELGVRVEAKEVSLPAPFEEKKSHWTYINLVRPQQVLHNAKGEAWSWRSRFTMKPLNGLWVLDARTGPRQIEVFFETFKIGKGGKLVNTNERLHDYYSDWPGFNFTSALVTPGKRADGLKRAEPAPKTAFGELEEVEYYQKEYKKDGPKEGQAFKTYLMFKSTRNGEFAAYPVPIAVYSNWWMAGSAKWNKAKKEYEAIGLAQAEGTAVPPTAFEPEWDDRVQLGEPKKDN